MDIHDVIGSLRQKHLDVLQQIATLRMDVHLLTSRVEVLEDVSRETRHEVISDGDA